MVVGVCRLSLYLQGVRSLKGKRQIVRRIVERVRNRFQIAIAEVADQDMHQRATLGIALVGNQHTHIQIRLSSVLQAIESLQLGILLQPQIEIAHYGEDFGHSENYASILSLSSSSSHDENHKEYGQQGALDDSGDLEEDPLWDIEAEEAALQRGEDEDENENEEDDAIPPAWRDFVKERDHKP